MADDDTKSWTLRKMPPSDRQMAMAAAKRAGLTVPEWVSEAIRAHVARERTEPGEVIPPGQAIAVIDGVTAGGPPSLDDVSRAIDIAARVGELRGLKRKVPDWLSRRVNKLLIERLGSVEDRGHGER